MPVNIHGKEYLTVADRIHAVRQEHPEWRIITHLVDSGQLVVMSATIQDGEGKTIATGYAEEERGSSNINRTSALENAETSAVGRALAFAGYQGTEIASADEVVNAINQQAAKDAEARAARCMRAVLDCAGSVKAIKQNIANGELEYAAEAWDELSKDEKEALWLAESKGGPFTHQEREVIKTKLREYRQ